MAKPKSGARLRYAAASAANVVVAEGRNLETALASRLQDLPENDRSLTTEIAFGSVRWFGFIDALIASMTGRPTRKLDPQVRMLLVGGIYQLWKMRVPDHAAISETVSAVALTKGAGLRGLVNALLRRFQREGAELIAAVQKPAEQLSHPQWWLDTLKKDWPREWEAIARANNERAPMWLRVNLTRSDLASYQDELQNTVKEPAEQLSGLPAALKLAQPMSMAALPGFAEGRVSIQDGGAQLATLLLDPQAGERVLDACAAPGGKSAHMLETCNGELILTAIDNDARRLENVQQTLDRVGHQAQLICADAGATESWWDGQAFDRVLIDAPCSASGVIRRHPDIKFTRRARDIPVLAKRQLALLDALWPLLRPGGRLLYVTCSVLDAENSAVVNEFLKQNSNAVTHSKLPAGTNEALMVARPAGWQVLPGTADLDGFYFACIEKTL